MTNEAHEPPLTAEQSDLVAAHFACAMKRARHWSFRCWLDRDECEYHAERALMRAARGFDPARGFKFLTYLRSVMDMEFRSWRANESRKRRRRGEHGSIEDVDLIDYRRDGKHAIDDADEAACILGLLSDRERDVVLMRVEGCTYAEIGLANGYTDEWARMFYGRTRAKLRDLCAATVLC